MNIVNEKVYLDIGILVYKVRRGGKEHKILAVHLGGEWGARHDLSSKGKWPIEVPQTQACHILDLQMTPGL